MKEQRNVALLKCIFLADPSRIIEMADSVSRHTCPLLPARHGSKQQLGEEQRDNTTQLLLVPLLGTHQSTPTNVHSRLGAQHLKTTVV